MYTVRRFACEVPLASGVRCPVLSGRWSRGTEASSGVPGRPRRLSGIGTAVTSGRRIVGPEDVLPSEGSVIVKAINSWRRTAGGLALAAVFGVSLDTGPAAAAAGVPTWMVAQHSGKCLDVVDASRSNGAKVQQYTCHSGLNQQWILWPKIVTGAGIYHEIRSLSSDKCLDIEGVSQANRARAEQYTCHGGDNQLFLEVFYGGGPSLVARHSGKCLDIEGDYITNGAKLWQYTCDYDLNQQFTHG